MSDQRFCPKCGKVMKEEPGWPGYWRCPDYNIPLNDEPPYEFKCTGSHLTDAGADLLEREIMRQMAARN